MLLAEGIASNERGQVNLIANFIGASYFEETLAAADLWSELAVRLAEYSHEFVKRRASVVEALNQ